jgi:hypothetical protein
MADTDDFLSKLKLKVSEQLKSQKVGYLLGAGSSYLDNRGYPLAFEIWDRIKRQNQRQAKAERYPIKTRQRG